MERIGRFFYPRFIRPASFAAAVLAGMLLFSCADRIVGGGGTERLQLSVTILSDGWLGSGRSAGARFITPDVRTVHIEARADSAKGTILAEADWPVSVDADSIARASGLLDIPSITAVVIVATGRDESGASLAIAQSDPFVPDPESATVRKVSLMLFPAEGSPNLVDLAAGSNSVTIPVGKSRVLRFSSSAPAAYIRWPMAAAPDLEFQVRNTLGSVVTPGFLNGALGIKMGLSGTGSQYLLVYNKGATEVATNFTLVPAHPLLVAANAAGQAYTSPDGSVWSGPYATGLSEVRALTYGNGVFIAVGRNADTSLGLSTSLDGINWSPQSKGQTSAWFVGLAVNSSGHFQTMAYYGATISSYNSIDGVNWTGPETPLTWGGGVGPAWTNGYWYRSNTNLSIIQRSSDGIAWNAVGTSGIYQAQAMLGVNGRLIIGGGDPSDAAKRVVVSADSGASFGALLGVAGATGYVQALAANPGNFRVLSAGTGTSAQVHYSDDYGTTWTAATGTGSADVGAVLWYPNGFLIGNNAGTVYRSADGAAFTALGSAGSTALRGLAYRGAP